MVDTATDIRQYLDPKVLAKVSGLELRARLVVEGFYAGTHESPQQGVSSEFADYRPYVQGDDLRHIDWKIYGKTNKYYIKEYEQETNLNLMLVVDASESMRFCGDSRGLSKHGYATSLAAAVAYLSLKRQDAVGAASFDDRLTKHIKPSNHGHHWKNIIQTLEAGSGDRRTSLRQVLAQLCERLGRRTLVLLISDLFADPDETLVGIRQLRHHHHDVIVWNTWDHLELTFPFERSTMFEGLEATGRMHANPKLLRAGYLREVQQFQARLRQGCGQMHVDYMVIDTSSPLDVVLTSYLTTRAARLRRRSSRVLGG